ncbi:hypothetical protein [Sphaerisporangium rubeum]|uniref:hypothetical protein n=1 Tax=Sphaerisporangium rubeum TaxID=321317 RepID=UPI0031E3A0C1
MHERVRHDAATRSLCAGVYVDRDFRDLVIRDVYCDVRHRVSPAYGYELIPVVRHAWWAWILETARYAVVLVVLTLGLFHAAPAVVMMLTGLALCHMARIAYRSSRVAIPLKVKALWHSWLRRARWNSDAAQAREHTRMVQIALSSCLGLLLVPLLVAWIAGMSLAEVVRQSAVLTLLCAAITAVSGAVRKVLLNRARGPVLDGVPGARLTVINDQERHPCVVYSRTRSVTEATEAVVRADPFDQPSMFFGAGRLVHRWMPPLVIRLLPKAGQPADGLWEDGAPFKAHELVDHLRARITDLRRIEGLASLRGLKVSDRLYVAEEDVAVGPREWLRGEPPTPEDINGIIDRHFTMFHHFLEIRVSDTGEVVTTVFLRVTVKGRALSLDFAACALTRTPVEYHLTDALTPDGARGVVRSALRGVQDLPRTIYETYRLVRVPVVLVRAARARNPRSRAARRGATVGPLLSIRQLKSATWQDSRLDQFTIQDHIKIIEQHLLKAAEDFLTEKGLDTSAFTSQATTIINSGVLNMGGKTEINQAAVGAGAEFRIDTRLGDGEG